MNPEQPPILVNDDKGPLIVYVLYLASLIFGLSVLIGLVWAYVQRSTAPDWIASHYQFAIRTFWIGFLYTFVGIAVVVGTFGLGALFVGPVLIIWFLVRVIKALITFRKGLAHPDPTSWLV